jgi:predicted DCC family thiol-disulfide oxidoreductase YuxK
MVYDGDCNFCSLWIRRWQHAANSHLEYLPFQDPAVAARFPEVPRSQFEQAVQLVETNGCVYGGAEAVFRALAHNPHKGWLLDWYEQSPVFARASEWGYGVVARHRTLFSRLTRLAWGSRVEAPTHDLVRAAFLRSLGIIYLVAFVSLWVQIVGLVGSQGILPASSALEAMSLRADAQNIGLDRYHLVPTLCWLNPSDAFLKVQCAAGTVLAVILLLGIAPAPCLFLLWVLYLSLTTICREFLAFQWDRLLLEAGLLAIFLAPLPRWRRSPAAPPSRLVLWLLRLLLFKLMLQSGCVKLLSGDPVWHNLTALRFHYETQPLPTWIGWYAFQLPASIQKACAVAMFGIELVVPFLIFAPRRPRQLACVILILFQVLILLTGNYAFFNLLTIALCLLLLDDAALQALIPSRLRTRWLARKPAAAQPQRHWPPQLTVPLACIAIATALMQFGALFRIPIPWPRPMLATYAWLMPLRSFNSYGLFAVMTTSRREIVIEGSDDAVNWQPYEFKYKPGDPKRAPQFVAPYQPRLDWQMWFAALGTVQQNPWFLNVCLRLLEGSPPVLALFEKNPFPHSPPHYVRAVLYDYHFTNRATRRKTGAWWSRHESGVYLPPLSLPEQSEPPAWRHL